MIVKLFEYRLKWTVTKHCFVSRAESASIQTVSLPVLVRGGRRGGVHTVRKVQCLNLSSHQGRRARVLRKGRTLGTCKY